MNLRFLARASAVFTATFCMANLSFAQTEQFDNVILDGGGNQTPILQYNTGDDDGAPNHQIGATEERMFFNLDKGAGGGGINTIIEVFTSSQNRALVLDGNGLELKGGNGVQPSFDIRSLDGTTYGFRPFKVGTTEGLDLNTESGNGVMTVRSNARAGTLTLDRNGIGIGPDGLNATVDASLHILANTFPSPLNSANILLEDLNSNSAVREMLRFRNNGGSAIRFDNQDLGLTQEIMADQNGFLLFGGEGGNSKLSLDPSAPNNSVHAGPLGVAIGHLAAEEMLHVKTDGSNYDRAAILVEDTNGARALRNMLELKNNGGVRIRLNNTSIGESWAMSTDQTNKLQFRVIGAAKPFFGQRGNGFFEVGTDGRQNFTLTPTGNAFVRGTLRVQSILETSDRNAKEDFEDVNADDILQKVVSLPMTTWKYKGAQDGTRHIGPIAQDFQAAFKLSDDDKTIAPLDTAGVSLVAIQGLHKQMKEKDAVISELQESNDELLERIERLEAAVSQMTSQN